MTAIPPPRADFAPAERAKYDLYRSPIDPALPDKIMDEVVSRDRALSEVLGPGITGHVADDPHHHDMVSVPPSNTENVSAFGASYAFEHVYARLLPFQGLEGIERSHPLYPISQTGGLAFPYNPSISEGTSVNYSNIEITHSNESYHSYKSTENVRINLQDCIWTCDTFDNAVYALSVLHFLRSYSLMDFGRGRTGRPPSPMWFSAYGMWIYNRVPVLLEKADFSFPNDVDYVGIPEFGTPEYGERKFMTHRGGGPHTPSGKYSWMPVKFTVSSISLIVQHAPAYWTNFNLDDYRSGAMIDHRIRISEGGGL